MSMNDQADTLIRMGDHSAGQARHLRRRFCPHLVVVRCIVSTSMHIRENQNGKPWWTEVPNDSRIIARTRKYVDLCGVDDRKVDDLELVTAGAVVKTQKGPIIIIMNQCARMANRKTIHSSGQMEHHKIIVKDQAHAITNIIPHIELHEGCQTPLCVISVLTYMKMCAPTDEELDTLPHITITSDAPWDLRILDLIPPDEWCSDQPKCLELIEEPIFDGHGGYKESLVSTTEDDAKKILDAETHSKGCKIGVSGEHTF
jgi:hypothetical protein